MLRAQEWVRAYSRATMKKFPVSISEAFDETTTRYPERTALAADAGRGCTYAQLAARADQIASWLVARGIGRGKTVGLFAQRSPDTIAAIIGILKAGAAYVPLDPAYPTKLLQYIYEDSKPSAMLVHDAVLASRPQEVFWTGEALTLGADTGLAASAAQVWSWPEVSPDDVAYVMYTSGSTGRPKGVVVPHRAVLRLVLDNDFATLGPDEVILQMAPLSFDASTFEIWGALLNGGKLAVVSNPYPSLDDIAAEIARHGVTTMWLTAGLFHLMVDNNLEGLKPLRQLLAGGDVLSPPHIVKALRARSNRAERVIEYQRFGLPDRLADRKGARATVVFGDGVAATERRVFRGAVAIDQAAAGKGTQRLDDVRRG